MKTSQQQSLQSRSQPSLDFRRQALEREIKTYREKLGEYEQLQKEINEINIHINDNFHSKNGDNRKPNKPKPIEDGKSKSVGNSRRSSNKKIKIYELQKKLDKLVNDYREKKTTYEKSQDNHSKLLRDIETKSRKIQEERQTSQKLKQLEKQIESDIQISCQKIDKVAVELEQSVKNKELFNFEKRKLRDQLRNLRNSINRLLNGYQEEDLELSISQQLKGSSDDQSEENRKIEQMSLQIEAKKELDIVAWMSKQNRKIEDLMNKVEICEQKAEELTNTFFNLKKEMTSNEVLIQHHKLTINLLTSQLKNYQRLTERAQSNCHSYKNSTNQLSHRLSQLEGERGYLRGRIGVRIEQQRLIRGLNILLQCDQEKLRQKISHLQLIRKISQIKDDRVQTISD